jgi:uncharacterized protein YlxP (DUF503 family)
MRETMKAGTILIKEGTRLPDALTLQSEPYSHGWRSVIGLDGNAMDRKIRDAGWTFFCLAGETKATVFGVDEEKMVRRAVKQIAEKLKSQFNSLEITRVSSEPSKRFFGVRYVTVSAQSRHIQESLFLLEAKGRQEFVPSRMDSRAQRSMGLETGKEPRQKRVIEERIVAPILNS